MIGLRRGEHGVAVGREVGGEALEEARTACRVEAAIHGDGAPREHRAGGFATLRDERAQELGQALGAALRAAARDAGPERADDLLENRARGHGAWKRSRNTFFCTFPIAFLGRASTK